MTTPATVRITGSRPPSGYPDLYELETRLEKHRLTGGKFEVNGSIFAAVNVSIKLINLGKFLNALYVPRFI
jgi:hypothetical protein